MSKREGKERESRDAGSGRRVNKLHDKILLLYNFSYEYFHFLILLSFSLEKKKKGVMKLNSYCSHHQHHPSTYESIWKKETENIISSQQNCVFGRFYVVFFFFGKNILYERQESSLNSGL
jgi:hypothetical protein